MVDIETTGLSKYRHAITEIGAVRIKNGKIHEEFQTLVNPQKPIPKFITKLTGINDEMVKDAPSIGQVMPKFLDFLGNSCFIAHNASFDHGFLTVHAKQHCNTYLENNRLCTRKLANRLLPELPSKRLGSICEHLGVINKQAHRALGDAYATAQIFIAFQTMMKEQGIIDLQSLLTFERNPRKK